MNEQFARNIDKKQSFFWEKINSDFPRLAFLWLSEASEGKRNEERNATSFLRFQKRVSFLVPLLKKGTRSRSVPKALLKRPNYQFKNCTKLRFFIRKWSSHYPYKIKNIIRSFKLWSNTPLKPPNVMYLTKQYCIYGVGK